MSEQNIPEWAQALKVQTPGVVDAVPKSVLSGADRIEAARAPSEFDETVAHSLREHPDDGLGTLLMLLEPPQWMLGLWGNHPEGWTNARADNKLLTFADARALVDARIAELGLDAEKVYAYPKSHSTLAEHMAFLHASFEDQMNQFRLQHGEGKTNGN